MRSAQRKARIAKSKGAGKKGIRFKLILVLISLVLGSAIWFLSLGRTFWNGRDKLAFIYPDKSGDVVVVVLDPLLDEKTFIIIPGDTHLTVAGGYGELRIKNVWQLGVNEKLHGQLLAQTVMKNFHFPLFLWSEKGIVNTWEFLISPGKTNINPADRLALALFALKVKAIDSSEIDLGKSQFLKKQNLVDGSPGFVVNGPLTGRLTVYFTDNSLAGHSLKFGIVDAGGKHGIGEALGKTLEVLGGKIVAIEKEETKKDLDCEVAGTSHEAIVKISKLFSCTVSNKATELDLEVRFGSKFAERY